MTSKDAMESGQDELYVDPDWPGLKVDKDVLFYDVEKLRGFAGELETLLTTLKSGSGTVETVRGIQLGEAEIGKWKAASDLAHSVGNTGGGQAPRGAAGLAHVYGLMVKGIEDVAKALRSHADTYEKYDPDGVRPKS
ncbi:hypothetical protein [Nonomuraea sp. NPDC005501]|uniref:hypothetical protein n=1 Tax=Nonomuraea sp. NPDC005501 TaxID=3156884 RepID=UPI0033A09CF3